MTKKSLKYQNQVTHNDFLNLTDSEGEDVLEMKCNEVKEQQIGNKKE